MLRKQVVLNMIKIVTAQGKKATLTSNGFWGITPRSAREAILELKQAGLAYLTISHDSFHSPFINKARVENIIKACDELNLECCINCATTKSNPLDSSILSIKKKYPQVTIREFPVTPVGAATNLPESELYRSSLPISELNCPSFEPTFHYDGYIYPCCSPAVFGTSLKIGTVDGTPFEEALKTITYNSYFSVIRHEGFGWIYNLAISRGLIPRLEDSIVTDACSVCRALTLTPHVLQSLANDITSRAKFLMQQS